MRGMIWLVGCMVIGLALGGGFPSSGARLAVWISAAGLWFFIGCGLALMSLAKLVSGKTVAGLAKLSGPGAHSSATQHDGKS